MASKEDIQETSQALFCAMADYLGQDKITKSKSLFDLNTYKTYPEFKTAWNMLYSKKKYSVEEIKVITFLIAMLKLDVDTAVALKKAEQHAGVSQDQIRDFCGKENMSSQLLDAFEEFRLTVSGPEVMDELGLKPGPELGKAIQKIETDNFEKLL
jgi:hypothetical protein